MFLCQAELTASKEKTLAGEELITERCVNDMTGLLVSFKEALFVKAMAWTERTFDRSAFGGCGVGVV
ncbi:MAG: hypothetical protein LBK73_16510 [Treponema sp.]|nr:hypothetical protein [Treponema sp.]